MTGTPHNDADTIYDGIFLLSIEDTLRGQCSVGMRVRHFFFFFYFNIESEDMYSVPLFLWIWVCILKIKKSKANKEKVLFEEEKYHIFLSMSSHNKIVTK